MLVGESNQNLNHESGCLFCKLGSGELPSYKIYEDEDYFAILDIYPNITGQALVIPFKHVSSYVFDLEDKDLEKFAVVTKKVAKILERSLDNVRVHLVLEGTAINHLHAKLYPAIGMKSKNEHIYAEEFVYFPKYLGFVCTLLGPRANDEDLKDLQKKILAANPDQSALLGR